MDVLQELKKVFLFSEVPDSALKLVAEAAEERTFSAGQTIASENEPGDTLFLVRNGSVGVSKGGDATTLMVGQGGSFGQVAIFDGGKTGFDAVAVERVDLLAICAEKMRDKLAEDHEAAHHLYRAVAVSLARRLRQTVDALTLAREALGAQHN